MNIAVEGCSHGELDIIYATIERLQQIHKITLDLLLCCGDFQSVRNEGDLKCMAVPMKYMQMQDFSKYYSGEKKAPILTIFIGGNHEASNYLQELPYGGWVAPNIYYLGYAGIVRIGDLRIGGLSGIYKGADYLKGHFEKSPYTNSSLRSVYHIRNLEVFRLKQLSGDIDVFMSHDWPRGIYHHGNTSQLCKVKTHFRSEIESNTLGSPPAEDLLKKLKPTYWFSGHLHVKFSALLNHEDSDNGEQRSTKFLALDKCLPRREFLQVIRIPSTRQNLKLEHDAEWLTILRLTNHLLCTANINAFMPGPGANERYLFTPTEEEIEETLSRMGGDLSIKESDFVRTAPAFNKEKLPNMNKVAMPKSVLNPQTIALCSKLGIEDPMENFASGAVDEGNVVENEEMNMSELNVTDSSFFVSDTSFMSNTEFEEGEFELSRDLDSGDFVLEIPKEDKSSDTESKPKRQSLSLSLPKICEATEDQSSLNISSESIEVSSRSDMSASNDTGRNGGSNLTSSLKEPGSVVASESQPVVSQVQNVATKKNKLKRRNAEIYSCDE